MCEARCARQVRTRYTREEPRGEASPTAGQPHTGLRERKKAKTRALIQAQALRLFEARGYDETSVEEIAQAAEVSPRTIFRYFPTKADLVRYDALDERMFEAVRRQPPSVSALDAIRRAFASSSGALTGDDLRVQRTRERLMRTVPELRAMMLEELTRAVTDLAALIAERTGRPTGDDEVAALAGAVVGVVVSVWLGQDTFSPLFVERLDGALARLETGFRL